MPPLVILAHFLGGALLANAIPHIVHGISGHRFQTPFASPPGKGESSPLVNLAWGVANVVGGFLLVQWERGPGIRPPADRGVIALGGLAIAIILAWWFGKVRGAKGVSGDSLGQG